MRSLSRIECFNAGCNREASVTINGDHVCTQCAKADLPDDMHKFLPATKPAQTIADDACHLINTVRSGELSFTECEPTAAVSLARVTAMLAVYGSKDEAILHVIHEKGHTEVTLADVEHVRAFVLGEHNA